MTQTQILYAIIAGLAVAVAYANGFKPLMAWIRSRAAAQQTSREIMDRLAKAMLAHTEAAETNAKLLEGTVKACETVAISVTDLRDVVGSFTALMKAKPEPAPTRDDEVERPDDNRARFSGEVFAKVLEGMSPSQAEAEALADEEKRMMVSAISLGE